MGMCTHNCREGVCVNNAVKFQSCFGSSNCTAVRENYCTDIVSRQLRNSSMVRQWCEFTVGKTNMRNEHCNGRPSLVTPELMENVLQAVL